MRFRRFLRTAKFQLRKLQAVGIPVVRPRIIDTLPHAPDAFTQGLLVLGDRLYESTGLFGNSTLRVIERATGNIEKIVHVDDVFAEGIAHLGAKIYQLTWKSGIVLVYDAASLELIDTLPNDKPGWGVTSDGLHLIVSSGSSLIDYRDAGFRLVRSVRVTMNGLPLSLINDLAYCAGRLYFNVYRHPRVYEADAATGRVLRIFDLAPQAREEYKRASASLDSISRQNFMLNGIAIEQASRVAYVTGKMWSQYYRFEL